MVITFSEGMLTAKEGFNNGVRLLRKLCFGDRSHENSFNLINLTKKETKRPYSLAVTHPTVFSKY
jgi:hypothetical protein